MEQIRIHDNAIVELGPDNDMTIEDILSFLGSQVINHTMTVTSYSIGTDEDGTYYDITGYSCKL